MKPRSTFKQNLNDANKATYKNWFFKELYDKKEKSYRNFYLCPKKYVKFQLLI